MKIKVMISFVHKDNYRIFNEGDILKVDNIETSDFYHLWEKKDGKEYLSLIPKKNCMVVKE